MEGFFTFHNFFSLQFSGSNLKHCTFLFSCANYFIWKNSGSQVIGQKCSCPIRLQDALSIGISGSNVSISLILCIGIFTKERQHMTLLLLVGFVHAYLAIAKLAKTYQGCLWVTLGAFPGEKQFRKKQLISELTKTFFHQFISHNFKLLAKKCFR